MTNTADRSFDWIAGIALASGAAVVIPSLTVVFITVTTIVLTLV